MAAITLSVIFAFILIMTWLDARKKERMFLLKQGKDPNIADSAKSQDATTINFLKWGIIILNIGIGALVGSFCNDGRESVYFSFLLIFSGLGLVLSYVVTNNIAKKMKEKDIPKSDEDKNNIVF